MEKMKGRMKGKSEKMEMMGMMSMMNAKMDKMMGVMGIKQEHKSEMKNHPVRYMRG